MKRFVVTVAAALAFIVMAGPAAAQQQGTIEIGVDNSLAVELVQSFEVSPGFSTESRTDFDFLLPAFYWRFGYFASPQISIEVPVGVNFISIGNDGGTDLALVAGLNGLYNLPSGLFFGINGLIFYFREDPGGGGQSDSATRYGFGGQVGYRVPFIAENIRFRTALVYNYLLKRQEDGFPATHRIAAQFGLSVMTK